MRTAPRAPPPPASPGESVDLTRGGGGDGDGVGGNGVDDTYEDVAGDVPIGVDTSLHDSVLNFAAAVVNGTNATDDGYNDGGHGGGGVSGGGAGVGSSSGTCSYQQRTLNVSDVGVTVFTGSPDAMSGGELAAWSGVVVILPPGLVHTGGGCGNRTGLVVATFEDVDASSADGSGTVATSVSSLSWGLADSTGWLDGPSPPLGEPAQIVMPLNAPLAAGAAPCVSPALLDFSSGNDTCVAGCCEDGACVCREGFFGPRCEFELRCASASADDPTWGLDACATSTIVQVDGSATTVNCSCTEVDYVAALRFRLTPSANIDLYTLGLRVPSLLRTMPLAWLAPPLAYLLLVAWALYADWATLYSTSLPHWLAPPRGRFWFCGQFLFHLRTRQAMLRVYHVMPDHTPYSRLQLLHLLSTALTATFVAVILFLNKRQCTAEAAILAGVVAGCVASLPIVLGRALFKWANMHGRRRQAYKANKTTRYQVWIDGADAGKGFGGDRRGSEVSPFGGIAPSSGGLSSMSVNHLSSSEPPQRRSSHLLARMSGSTGGERRGSSSRTTAAEQQRRTTTGPAPEAADGAYANIADLGDSDLGDGEVSTMPPLRNSVTHDSSLESEATPRHSRNSSRRNSRNSSRANAMSHQLASIGGAGVLIGGAELPRPVAGRTHGPRLFGGSAGRRPSDSSGGGAYPKGGGEVALLPASKLFASPDGRGGVGVLMATASGGIGVFVPATHVRAPLWGTRLYVSLDPRRLPPGRTAQTLQERETLSHDQAAAATKVAATAASIVASGDANGKKRSSRRRSSQGGADGQVAVPIAAGLGRTSLSWPKAVAWGYNLAFGLLALVLLVSLVLGAAESGSSAERLRASGMSLSEWWRAVSFAFTWTLFQSLVLVDLLKVLMFTFTSPVFMHRLPKGSLRRILGTQLLRSMHKVMEAVL